MQHQRPDLLVDPPVAAVVLAAGLSRRMGSHNKLLLSYQGQPMVRHVAMQALASQCSPVLVVLGHEPEAVRAALAGLPVQFVDNPGYAEGLGASVRAGALAAPRHAPLLVLLGDMPQVDTTLINTLVGAYAACAHANERDAAAKYFQPVFNGQPGNPVLWGAAWQATLQQLHGDEGARHVIRSNPQARVAVPVSHAGVLHDVDQPSDLSALGMSLL